MLLRLSAEQIADHWGTIEHAIKQSLPPMVDDESGSMNVILEQLLAGNMQCWVLTDMAMPDEKTGQTTIFAVIVTTVVYDLCSGTRSLLLYSLSSFRPLVARDWAEGFYTFSKFGKSLGCKTISAYTNIDGLVKMAEKLGGDGSWRYVKIPVFND